MQIVSREVVNNYRWNKWLPRCDFLALVLLVIIGIGLAFFSPFSHRGWVVFGIWVGSIYWITFHPPRTFERELSWNAWQLLQRWERHSGRPLSAFPTSQLQTHLLHGWASSRMRRLALALNAAYAEQNKFKHGIASLKEGASHRKLEWYAAESRRIDANVETAKAAYLNFWDLVTERNGIGILRGYDWYDPETFRQKMLWIYSPGSSGG